MNGWYYDTQLENELTSVSLHPNKIWNKTTKGWEIIQKEGKGPDEGDGETFRRDTVATGGGYRNKPIARAILTEDFNVSIANNWSNINGDDVVSGIWNGIRTIAPYTPIFDFAMTEVEKNIGEKPDDQKLVTALKRGIGNLAGRARKLQSALEPHLNEQLIVQGTRFAYYAGSGTAFGNLGLKFTMFPTFDDTGFKSVVDQAEELLYYSNGFYKDDDFTMLKTISEMWATTISDSAQKFKKIMSDVGNQLDTWTSQLAKGRLDNEKNPGAFENAAKNVGNSMVSAIGITLDAGESVSDDIATIIMDRNLIAWQSAPGGYVPSYRDINEAIEGTLKLRIGTQYAISSLLCQDATLNFSKTMVKNPYNGDISPLYCDVNLTLTPASKFANNRLLEFIGATGTRNIYKNEISTTLGNKLQAEKNRIEINYNNV